MSFSKTEKIADALNRLGTLRPDAPLGVLDIGSNSVRLVGYSGSARTPLPIYNERAFCRLGEAVATSGRIEGAPYDLAIQTFHRFRAIAAQLGIGNLAAFATAAVRDAANGAEFVAEAEAILGTKIRVLTGQEEANFSADGVMLSIRDADGIVADLGGGSLELVRVKDNQTHQWATLPLGVLALELQSNGDLQAAGRLVEAALADLDWLSEGRDLPLYVVGGTWRSLAKVHMTFENYPLDVLHHYAVPSQDMLAFADTLVHHDANSEVDLENSSSNRRDALPIAAIVLDRLAQKASPKQIIVSSNAVREGVLYSILEKKFRQLDPLLLACEEMAERMCKSAAYGHELAAWSRPLFAGQEVEFTDAKQLNRLRMAGCLISDMGWSSHSSFRADFVRQTVLTAPFGGIDHYGRLFLAQALSFRHEIHSLPEMASRLQLSPKDGKLAQAFGLSLRLAHSLSASLPELLPLTRLQARDDVLTLTMDPSLGELRGPIIDNRLRRVADALQMRSHVEMKSVELDAPD
jgi:exopolyphosphatase/guanosine-5'-triphosphate,3'-diphosphate pyrophosphatase